MKRLVLDTGVIVEYIVQKSPYRPQVVRLFDQAYRGEFELYVSTVTLSETLYISSRIYQVAGLDDPNKEALNFVDWIKSKAGILEVNENIALRAGELMKALRLPLSDCYVIASAETINALPLFKKVEKEMKPVLNSIKKLKVLFLDEMKL
ncbi:MAG: PIN domain-containing protein [Desulfurococcales archaeon]|nr:PIN domain-containing protein [Desulfurococcales archaeon]